MQPVLKRPGKTMLQDGAVRCRRGGDGDSDGRMRFGMRGRYQSVWIDQTDPAGKKETTVESQVV